MIVCQTKIVRQTQKLVNLNTLSEIVEALELVCDAESKRTTSVTQTWRWTDARDILAEAKQRIQDLGM